MQNKTNVQKLRESRVKIAQKLISKPILMCGAHMSTTNGKDKISALN